MKRIAALALSVLLVMLCGCASKEKPQKEKEQEQEVLKAPKGYVSEIYSPYDPTIKYPVTPESPIKESAARINNMIVGNATVLEPQFAIVDDFNKNEGYQHHPFITYFKGKFYVAYSQAETDEAGCGMRAMMAVSDDCINWSEPFPIVDTREGVYSKMVINPDGFYTDGKTLAFYYFAYEYAPETLRGKNLRPPEDGMGTIANERHIMYTTDGENWTDKVYPFGAYNMGPRMLLSGRLLKVGSTAVGYTDDITGLSDWVKAGPSKTDVQAAFEDGIKDLNEGCFYQLSNGVIRCMLRSEGDRLYCMESYDNAQTWTRPYKTNFTNDASKTYFGTLPDGRYFFVGTMFPDQARFPFMLCISEDGYSFGKQYVISKERYHQQKDGLFKGGSCAYPTVIIVGDNMYMVYSKGKEVIETAIIPLSQLGVEKNEK